MRQNEIVYYSVVLGSRLTTDGVHVTFYQFEITENLISTYPYGSRTKIKSKIKSRKQQLKRVNSWTTRLSNSFFILF